MGVSLRRPPRPTRPRQVDQRWRGTDGELGAEGPGAGTERLVTVDGQVGATLGTSETLMVRRASRSVILVRFPEMTFFTRMRRKLGWGAPPDDPRA